MNDKERLEIWKRKLIEIEEIEKEEEVRQQVKELFVEKEIIRKPIKLKEKLGIIKKPIEEFVDRARKVERQKIIRYALPAIMLLLIVSVLFVSKPEITGYVVLTEEKTYDDNLNLVINESGNYTWTIDKIGDIKSIKASGKVKGNGTVKIYIEKDGKRYLIYDNKK